MTREPGTTRSGPRPLAVRLELKSLTAGSVALAATVVSANSLLSNISTNISSKARFILSTNLLFQEVGAETHIKYHEDFDHYKQFIIAGFESPGMITTFKQLNQEVLGISSPADPTGDDDDNGLHDGVEEDEMMAELWKEPGLSFTGSSRHISNPHCHRKSR